MPPQAPTARLSAPSSVRLGVAFSVDASGSTDGPGGGGIRKYEYDFGDGTTEDSPDSTASHAYHDTEGQPYLCTVTVTNKKGRSNKSAPVTVEVLADAPPVPVDCVWAKWPEWHPMPVEWTDNGNGTESRSRTRVRTKAVEAAHGGKDCEGQDWETETETRPITVPDANCVLSETETIVSEIDLELCRPDGSKAVEVAWTRDVLVPATGHGTCVSSGTRIEKRACVYIPPVPPSGDGNTYFEALRADPACIVAFGPRSQAELDLVRPFAANPTLNKQPILYDPALDAARLSIYAPASTDSQQKHFPLGPITSGSVLVTFDFRLDEHFRWNPKEEVEAVTGRILGYLKLHKSWRFDPPWLALKTDYQRAANRKIDKVPAPEFAELIMTLNNSQLVGPGTTRGSLEVVFPLLAQWFFPPIVWQRAWMFVEDIEQPVCRASLWAADETREPVQLYDRINMLPPVGGFEKWRFIEFDTSTEQALNPQVMHAWNRNLLVFHNLTHAAVVSRLQKPVA